METTEGQEGEDGGGPRVKCTRQVHPRSYFSHSTLRKAELKRRDSRETRKFRRRFRIPYEFLELVKLAKRRKWFSLAARDVAGRQCILVELKISRSCCSFCQKRNVVYGLGSR